MTTVSERAPAPAVLALRRPAWLFAPLGMTAMCGLGLLTATLAAMALQGAGWRVAQGLSVPALAAAALTALEIGPRLLRGQLQGFAEAAWRSARAWGAIGAAWPLAFAVGGALDGVTGDPGAEALRVLTGLGIGAGAGALAGWAGAALALVRAAPTAATS